MTTTDTIDTTSADAASSDDIGGAATDTATDEQLAALAATIPNAPQGDLVRALKAIDMIGLEPEKVALHLRGLLGDEHVEALLETDLVQVDDSTVSSDVSIFVLTPTRLMQLSPTTEVGPSGATRIHTEISAVRRSAILGTRMDVISTSDPDSGETYAYMIAGFTTGATNALEMLDEGVEGFAAPEGRVGALADIKIVESASYVDADAMDRVMHFVSLATR